MQRKRLMLAETEYLDRDFVQDEIANAKPELMSPNGGGNDMHHTAHTSQSIGDADVLLGRVRALRNRDAMGKGRPVNGRSRIFKHLLLSKIG